MLEFCFQESVAFRKNATNYPDINIVEMYNQLKTLKNILTLV